jgi:hypothetical protein
MCVDEPRDARSPRRNLDVLDNHGCAGIVVFVFHEACRCAASHL